MKAGNKKLLTLVAAVGATTLVAGCEYTENLPFEWPFFHESHELGAPGLGMQWVINPKHWRELEARNVVPQPHPPASPDGPRASEIYQNVPVLGHLSIGEFNRLMVAMTDWVSPQEGCTYCHQPDDMAAEAPYTKLVSRAMLEMTIHANESWQAHVGETGVTCYTCHRGNPIPEWVWSKPVPNTIPSMMTPLGQNMPSWHTTYSALPYDPMSLFLEGDQNIRVTGSDALPVGQRRVKTKKAEETFALMFHISRSLGVGCVYCHDARAFERWDFSRPTRVTAWHAIKHVREMNNEYINPLLPLLPDQARGPMGDALKIGCHTCHQEAYKPLLGVSMLADYPELASSGPKADAEEAVEVAVADEAEAEAEE
ncbi:photosynthetic reaction center cytochrome PufC [Thioalkalicoccus limnaeus]|uniref:Photosynthetic reaction center cytochrome c subunit n=1 Tax=Thioalkalicoccus limnaeus TaxID=120681 RepID=A0ABV4BKZ0_9GAMM